MMTCSSPTGTSATPASASSSSTADHRWVSAHLYYHDAHDALLCGAVRPLVGELATDGLIDGYFFVRYWQGGPHVRLRVLLREQADAPPVERVIEDRIGQFFARHPSRTHLRSEDYQRSASWLSHHEFGPGGTTIEPLQPNNTLRFRTYIPEEDRLGGPAGVAAFEPHFMDSAALALEVIAANPSESRRRGRALSMMLLAAAVAIPDPERLARYFHRSYRNWAIRRTSGDRARAAREETGWHQCYDRQRAQLGGLARHLLSEDPGGHLDAISARWVASVSCLFDRLTEAQRARMALLFQCLHKHNNRLGVTVADETYLLFLLHRMVTEITDGKGPR